MGPTTRLIAASLLAVASASAAAATVLYESAGDRIDFTPGSTLALSFGWVVRDSRPTWPNATQFAAMPFSLSQDSSVKGVELALTSLADWSGRYGVQILTDSAGMPGTSPVWAAADLAAAPVYSPGATYALTSATGPAAELLASTQYWLYVTCAAACNLSWWADSANPAPGAIQYNSILPYDLRWTRSDDAAAMFRINGDMLKVPEPSTLLLTLGLVGYLVVWRSARRSSTRGADLE